MWRRRIAVGRLSAAGLVGLRLPDSVYVALVGRLFTSITPIVVIGLALALVGGLTVARTHDGALALVGCCGIALVTARGWLIIAHRVGAEQEGEDRAAARTWERRYAVVCLLFAGILGLFITRSILIGDIMVELLATGLLFGYCSGLVARLAVRPAICAGSLLVAAVPAALAMASQSFGADPHDALGYLAHSLVIAIFAFGSLETVAVAYHGAVRQLLTNMTLASLARQDALTGLPNRLVLRERFDDDIVRLGSGGRLLALHFLDLDRFKPVNDLYGHPVGDALLKAVAQRLSSNLRRTDTAVRLGGDEFAIVQTAIGHRDEAHFLARRVIKALSAPYIINEHAITIGVSIGIAIAPEDGLDLQLLSRRADEALYAAKTEGRGVISFWQDGLAQPLAAIA